MNQAFEIIGASTPGDILIVVDHAANALPPGASLGISNDLMNDHIAYDIGVDAIARIMVQTTGFSAILGKYSRLWVDLNRHADEAAALPTASDGIAITANEIDDKERKERLERYHHPYHDRVSSLIDELRPSMLLSLHSFTPKLRTQVNLERPWEIGVLYNEYETASKLAIEFLETRLSCVGDQEPYSGKQLNATMDRHAESIALPYTGVEIRQDLIAETPGQENFAEILTQMCKKVSTSLAS